MVFDKVIGQQDLKQQLIDLVKHNRLSHALLFLGKEGSGALPLALAFAQYVVCQPKPVNKIMVADIFGDFSALPVEDENNTDATFLEPEQLDTLPTYNRASQFIHPDLHFSFPVITKKPGERPTSADFIALWREFIVQLPYGNVFDWLQKIGAENKQGNITAEECNDIIKKLSLKSFESPWKVLLMWMPEYLGKEGNKLLKLIEEPPPQTLFILVAENEEKLLPTIISRCQLIRVPALKAEDIEAALISRANSSATTARQISVISDGNYREALHLLQHSEEDWQDFLSEWLKNCIRNLLQEQLKWIEEVAKMGREKQKQFLVYFIHQLQQGIRLKILGEENIAATEKEIDFVKRLNKIADIYQKEAVIIELEKACYYIERNANAKMLFQALTIKMNHIFINKVVPEFV